MAQQKKRNVAAISYSSLHEKLGESQRELRRTQECLGHASEEIQELEAALEQSALKYWKLKDSSIGTITKLQMAVATLVILLIAALAKGVL